MMITTHFDAIERIIKGVGVVPEGNCYYEHNTFKTPDTLLSKRNNLVQVGKHGNRILEVGFGAGHSCVLFLVSNPHCKVHVVDDCAHPYTIPCYDYLTRVFPDRLTHSWGKSNTVLSTLYPQRFDIIHLDGGIEYQSLSSDIHHARQLAESYTWLVVDDVDDVNVSRACKEPRLIPIDGVFECTPLYPHRLFKFSPYYGQYLQDKFVNENFFKDKRNGVFLDVGAYDGVSISNSLFFEKELGWTGICVEPSPTKFMKLCKYRTSIAMNYAIDKSNGMSKFLSTTGYTDTLAGLVDHYDQRHLSRIHNEISALGGQANVIPVHTISIESLLERFGIRHIDYMSVDVEGGEMAVLQSINFDKVRIDVIDFEDNYTDISTPIVTFLKKNGYVFHTKLGGDIIMVHQEFKVE